VHGAGHEDVGDRIGRVDSSRWLDEEVTGLNVNGERGGFGGETVAGGPLLKLLPGQVGPCHPQFVPLFAPRGINDSVVVNVGEGEGAGLATNLIRHTGREVVGLAFRLLAAAVVVAEVTEETVCWQLGHARGDLVLLDDVEVQEIDRPRVRVREQGYRRGGVHRDRLNVVALVVGFLVVSMHVNGLFGRQIGEVAGEPEVASLDSLQCRRQHQQRHAEKSASA
jgi:hypothetical protein